MFGAGMMFSALAAILLLMPGGQQPPSPNLVLRVSTPTYFTDGQVLGASSAGLPIQMNQPVVLYAYSGSSLCLSRSARPVVPSDAGYGWRVQIVPLQSTAGLVLQVEWQRMWDRGETLGVSPSAATRGHATVTLHPGDRLMLDYLTAADHTMANAASGQAPAVQPPACTALGMGLDIGVEPLESPVLVEANLWLVRTMPDGSEQSQRQTIRARPGTTVDYYFDDVAIRVMPSAGGAGVPAAEHNLRTFGRISPIDVQNGKVRMNLTIAQELAVTDPVPPSYGHGSSTFPLTAGPEEVLSFQVPQTVLDGGLGERLAVRIQVRQIR